MIHVFCPVLSDLSGTLKFTSIEWPEVKRILSSGYEVDYGDVQRIADRDYSNPNLSDIERIAADSSGSHVLPVHDNPADENLQRICWRHGWEGVRHLLNNSGFNLTDQIGRISFRHRQKMKPGDVGILFRGLGKPDLKSYRLSPADFEFTLIERIA